MWHPKNPALRPALISFAILSIFSLSPFVGYSQTLDETNKEFSDRRVKSFSKFQGAYVSALEMKLDPDCKNFKEIPDISIQIYLGALAEIIEGDQRFAGEVTKATEALRDARLPDGRRVSLAKVYLPLKEMIKRTDSSPSKEHACKLLAQVIVSMHQGSLDEIKFLVQLEGKRRNHGGK